MAYWGENYQNEEITTIEELCNIYGYNSLSELAISLEYVDPQGYEEA